MAYVAPPGYQSAFNPPIPYCTVIAGGLRVGMVVCVQATLPSNYNRFAINFTTGQEDTSDTAFHMNVRYDGRDRCVFNTKEGGVWGAEEMKRDVPFKSGKIFMIMYEVTCNNYQVFANGAPYYEYGHRIPLAQVNTLQVAGDICVQHLSIVSNGPPVKGGLILSVAQSNLLPVFAPHNVNGTVPFTSPISGGMIPRRSVIMKGMVKSRAKSFTINFKVGFTNDVALHLNARLSKKTVVRNSFINGTWGEEETALAKNPFKEGEYFEISVRSGEKHFEVFVNGSHCFNFAHRLFNLQQVDKLEVDGDVNIMFVVI
ncbi:galectin-4-like [Leptodactylus fuscus]|uniref:galectin-4-like n=1 Tax=Leptodactylus fuscus TaxID=238119 RepID=UPI003F4EC55D